MKTPERLLALRSAKKTLRLRDQKIARMKKRIHVLTAEKGVDVIDQDVQDEIAEVIKEKNEEMHSLPVTDFKRVFWDKQVCEYTTMLINCLQLHNITCTCRLML